VPLAHRDLVHRARSGAEDNAIGLKATKSPLYSLYKTLMSLPCRRAEDKLKERIVWIENFIEVCAYGKRRGE
jgi:hypothetical protein